MTTYVRDLVRVTQGSVTLLHVIGEHSASYGAADVYWAMDGFEPLRCLKRVQMSALARFRKEYFDGVPCDIAIEFGSPAMQIVAYAEHSDTDLIMMPSRGKGAGGGACLASTTATVLQNARCAVWISPHSDKLKLFRGFHSIVCALSPDRVSLNYVEQAAALGAAFGARVTFASAIPPGRMVRQQARVAPLADEYPEEGLDEVAAGNQ